MRGRAGHLRGQRGDVVRHVLDRHAAGRHRRGAVTGQVHGDDAERGLEQRNLPRPVGGARAEAVQQQHRRPRRAVHRVMERSLSQHLVQNMASS